MVDFQTVSVVIAAASVVIGVVNSILTSRRDERRNQLTLDTRQAQLFMALYDHYNSIDYKRQAGSMYFQWDWSGVDEFMERYGPDGNADNYGLQLCDFLLRRDRRPCQE